MFSLTPCSVRQFLALFLTLALSAPGMAAEVCRSYSFEGMEEHVQRVKGFLSKDTKDTSRIEIYVTQIEGTKYIQSNFISKDSSQSDGYHDFPTKLRSNEIHTVEQALLNIIYDDPGLVPEAIRESAVQEALKSATVFVDRSTVDHNGRPGIDLSGARRLRVVTGSSTLATGQVELLPLKKPPPSLVEILRGCCLKGRPPGRGREIMEMLASKKLSAADAVLLSMVVDTATDRVIDGSPALSAARMRSGFRSDATWERNVEAAMKASRGKPLLLLAHIEGGYAVVLNHRGQATFSISLKELRERAEESDTELFVIGCDTVQTIENNSMALGIVGVHNSRTLALKIAEVLPSTQNLADLAEGLSGPELTLVAYDKLGGNGYTGASAFASAKDEGFFVRVFRLLAVK